MGELNLEDVTVNIITNQHLSAFESLFKKHYAALCAFAHNFVNRPELAEEIVQDTFVKLWEKFPGLEIQISEKAYLYKAVQNNCLNYIKQDKVRQRYGNSLLEQLESRIHLFSLPDGHCPVDKLVDNDLQQLAEKAIRKLPAQCQDVFRLSRFEQLSYPEISRKLGISINTVKTQMTRALHKLRDELLPMLK